MPSSLLPSRALLLLLIGAASACAAPTRTFQQEPRTGDAIDQVIAPQVTPAFQTEVLVLGTAHLSGHKDRLQPGHLEPLLAVLEGFAPTRIAIEALTADEIALLADHEVHDPAAAELLDLFGRSALDAGRAMQKVLNIDRAAANWRARPLLAKGPLTDAERLELVAWLLAAYEFDSAVLQWSYLPPAVRERGGALPPDLQERLNRRLQSSNEVVTVAAALARRLGLQQLYAIDSQYDGVRTLSLPRDALMALFSDPARGQLVDKARQAEAKTVSEAAFAAGDLLPLYLFMNSHEHHVGDVSQWNWLFRSQHAAGAARFRFAMWEVRNIRQATNILDVAASTGPERLLVIVGASHKPHLDRLLATQLSVRLVQLEELAQVAQRR